MAVNKRLLQGAAAAGEFVPSEHFGVVLYEGDGSTSHSINGGKFGAAGYYNGSSSVDVGTIGGLLTSKVSSSISLWFNTSEASPNGDFLISTYTSSYFNYYVWLREAYGSLYVQFESRFAGNTTTIQQITPNINDGNWHHLVVMLDVPNLKNKMYIDGSFAVEGTISTSNAGGTNATIGGAFVGKIDQVRIFSKALSSSEVSTLYAETVDTVESLDPLSEDTTDTLQVLGDSSCVATYRFENDETDLSGNYDGTGTEIQYAAGRYGQAASYDGSNSKVSISALGFLTGDVNFSVSMWVKFENVSGDKCLFAQGANAGTFQATGYVVRNNNQVYHNNYGAADFFSGSFTFSADVWTHIAFSYNSTSNVHTMYINGSSAGTLTKEIALQSNNTGGCIGADQLGGTKFKGEIDQTRIFNKAISAAEVTTLYNENSLVASYRFEGNANDDTRNYDGTASNVTYEYGLGFTPDFVWIKNRTSTANNYLTCSSFSLAGNSPNVFLKLQPSTTNGFDTTEVDGVSSFDTGGFTVVNNQSQTNLNGSDYVAWCLKANGGTTVTNTDGAVTNTLQVNQDAGFSIGSWTGTGVQNASIGHGLSQAPEIIIYRNRSAATNWDFMTTLIDGSYDYLYLNLTNTKGNAGETSPSDTLAYMWSGIGQNRLNDNYVGYFFHSVEGF